MGKSIDHPPVLAGFGYDVDAHPLESKSMNQLASNREEGIQNVLRIEKGIAAHCKRCSMGDFGNKIVHKDDLIAGERIRDVGLAKMIGCLQIC